MSTLTILIVASGLLIIGVILSQLKNKKDIISKPIVPSDGQNVTPVEEIGSGEMPEKPLPVNCQLAQFEPAPQEFFYVDCCGNPHKGEGFQPWEKRAPVGIDSNKPFIGMILLDVEAEKDC